MIIAQASWNCGWVGYQSTPDVDCFQIQPQFQLAAATRLLGKKLVTTSVEAEWHSKAISCVVTKKHTIEVYDYRTFLDLISLPRLYRPSAIAELMDMCKTGSSSRKKNTAFYKPIVRKQANSDGCRSFSYCLSISLKTNV